MSAEPLTREERESWIKWAAEGNGDLALERIIATLQAAERGTFRQDLYYRLNVITIHLPPLRERPEDILPLAEAFISRIACSSGIDLISESH